MVRRRNLEDFLAESNAIEGIHGRVSDLQVAEAERFLELEEVTVQDLERFVLVNQPQAKLRTKPGMNVIIGRHTPPPGGPGILAQLEGILHGVNANEHPYKIHHEYETLHPFMDGNGRSGRILWAWQMINQRVWPGIDLGFLHAWYYQTLEFGRK